MRFLSRLKSFLRRLLANFRNFLRVKRLGLDARILHPVIIFQPGKVGSTTVQVSLLEKYKDIGIDVPVYHAHILCNIEERIEFVRQNRKFPKNTIKKLRESARLRAQIDAHPDRIWNVVTLVRDPVAIKVSSMFQNLYEYIPNWQDLYNSGQLTLDDLLNHLLQKKEFGAGGLVDWYDAQMKPLWGIDVFAQPFPHAQGYQIYRSQRGSLLLIRLEDLNRVAENAFEEFIGVKNLKIINTNTSEQKKYADLYRRFKERPLPVEYVDAIYATRFARHFYTDAELNTFRKNWIKQ